MKLKSTAESFNAIRPRYPEFKDRVALVTGSNQGIGKGIALRLAREGMKIVIHGKVEAEVEKTTQEFQALGVDAFGICTDFSEPDAVDRLFDAFRTRHDRLDIMVNNAADLRRTTVDNATTELLDFQLAVNVRAPYLCSLQAVPLMRPQKQGAIINISSVGGQFAHWRGLPYDVTKGANESMTRAMAINLANEGIRVNAIAPGAIYGIRTPPLDTPTMQAMSSRIPVGRLGKDVEIGAMVAFLASEDADYITGQVIFVDGGISAQISPPGHPI